MQSSGMRQLDKSYAFMEYDYIVIGAGSAGCVVAERLTEDASVTVLLLEAGGPDYRLDFRTQMPAALSYPLQGTRYNWAYETDPEPNLNNRRIQCGRGKGLGGSSLINGMCYIRGNALDFDGWAQAPGMQNWSYLHCLPYFRKAEKRDAGANDYHGDQGPLYVTTSKSTTTDPLLSAWIKAGHEAGYPITDDLNGYQQEGFGPMDRTVTSFGRRASTARSYLDLAKDRHNLRIETHANVDVIEFEQRIARAVRYFKGGATASTTVRAKREIIMCSGAIASPALLQRSGVGDKKLLESLGIEVVLDQPFVGENLQDHVEMYVQYACKEPVTLYPSLKAWRKPGIGAEWLFSGTGIGASNQFEAGAFVRSSQKQAWPNIQFHFLPLAICYNGTLPVMEHSFQMHVGSMRSESRGRIKIRSKHAHDAPSILFNYMSTPEDWEEMRSCLRVARDVARQPALKKFTGKELAPGAHLQSDKELDDFIRQHAETAFHPCGTCKMGEDDTAVVDSEGRVHGVKNLRVVDASIMPRIITGNLNATTIMMAEKISDLIRKKSSLSASTVSYFVAEQTR